MSKMNSCNLQEGILLLLLYQYSINIQCVNIKSLYLAVDLFLLV